MLTTTTVHVADARDRSVTWKDPGGWGIKEDALTEAAAVLMKCVPLADNLICVFERRFPTDVLILFTTSSAERSCKQYNCASPSAATVPLPPAAAFPDRKVPPPFHNGRFDSPNIPISYTYRAGTYRAPEIYRKVKFHVYTEKSNFSYPLTPPLSPTNDNSYNQTGFLFPGTNYGK